MAAPVMHAHRHLAPSAQDASLARTSGQRLSHYASREHPLSLRVTGQEQAIELPAGAVALLLDALDVMAEGRGITLVPENAELSTVEAASILNLSRPFLIKLLDDKVIPHRLVGKHRRILMDDVMAYKVRIDGEREAVLAQLTADAQENDMGYFRP